MTEETITIPVREYEELISWQRWIEVLYDNGLSDWEGMEAAGEAYRKAYPESEQADG